MNTPRNYPLLTVPRRFAPAPLALLMLSLVASGNPAPAANSVGLSSVRARAIDHFPLAGNLVDHSERFGYAFATGDFNGDGADDLATGIPYDNGVADIEQGIGGVYVALGAAGVGLATPSATLLVSQEIGPDLAVDDELFGFALAVGRFNDDLFDDLAVGVPGNFVGGSAIGGVHIYYGSANPGVFDGGFMLSIGGAVGDAIGGALAAGDLDGNGFDDLAVGIPGESSDAGAVFVIYAGAGGLGIASQLLQQNDPGIEDTGEPNDKFGFALTTGDFNADAKDDLVVGVPNENGYGAVHIFFGTALGLDLVQDLFWTQNTIAGTSEANDKFGFAVAAGDFDGDGRSDLAIGSPGEALGLSNEITNSGAVAVAYGSATGGFDLARTQGWSQGGFIGLDSAELGDRFGQSFAVGDFNRDGRDDLMIGHPEEDVTGINDGAVTVLLGGAAGFAQSSSRVLAAGTDAIPGTVQTSSNFGFAGAAGDFDGDGFDDLAIGIPYYNIGPAFDAGSELVLYGSTFADGFDSQGTGYWPAAVP
jgi:hypothetical protein